MEHIKNTTDFWIPERTAVSFGKFDGIHKGHRLLLNYLDEKKKDGLKTVIFTFDIPPKWRLDGGRDQKLLTTNEERAQFFAECGIDYLVECPFTEELMQMQAEEFVALAVNRLHIKCLAVGTDFRFGHNRSGDDKLLRRLSKTYSYELNVVPKRKENGRDISSTLIRAELLAGRLEMANALLGYPYFVQGVVVHGNEIGGALLGIPTLNLIPPKEKLLPPFGVYLTRTVVYEDGKNHVYHGITNVGRKPTIAGHNPVGVETHLLDFDKQIYGWRIKVEFLRQVRGEMRFGSLEELKAQMRKDVEYAAKMHN